MNGKSHESLRVVEWDGAAAGHAYIRIDERLDHALDRIRRGDCIGPNQYQNVGFYIAKKYIDRRRFAFAFGLGNQPDVGILCTEIADNRLRIVSTTAGYDQYLFNDTGGGSLFQQFL